VSRKSKPLLLLTLANVDRFSKFFYHLIHKKTKDIHLTCNMLLHCLVKMENPKNVADFDIILNKLLTHFEHLIYI